jgi:hypothetical protein
MKIRLGQLFIVSLLLHLAVVLAFGHYKHPVLWENGMIADNIYGGRGFSANFSLPIEPTSWQAPGYPYMITASWLLFGQGPAAYLFISVVQCLLLASMIWPMTALSRRWFPTIPILVVQVLTVLGPLYLWYGTRIHHTAFVMALYPWVLWGWLECVQKGRWQAFLVGAGTGLFALLQPVILGAFGIIGLVLLGQAVRKRYWEKVILLLIAGLAVLMTLTPWTIRNYQVHGRLLLIKSSFGKEFWMGNNPNATGTGYALGGAEEITNVYPPKCFEFRGKVSEIKLMNAMQQEATAWIKTNPRKFLSLTAHKIIWFWTLPPKDRVRSTGDAEALLFRGVYMTYWVALIALAITGCALRRPSSEYLWILALYIFFYSTVYGLTHVGQARFRGEIEFLFLPAAASGIFLILRGLSTRWFSASK